MVGIPLKDLLQRLSAKELVLSCNGECAEQKLQLRLKNHPVGEIMQALADMLPGSWQAIEEGKVNKGYKLVMKASSVSERNRWWQLFLQVQRAPALTPWELSRYNYNYVDRLRAEEADTFKRGHSILFSSTKEVLKWIRR